VVENVMVDDRFAAREVRVVELVNALFEGDRRLAEQELRLAERDVRIAELEQLLGESRRGGKRQAAPFPKVTRPRTRNARAASPPPPAPTA
jgi:uncharacterized coiled-coil protein SlyX